MDDTCCLLRVYFVMPYLMEIILCMYPSNERPRYILTSSLISWVHTQNDHCLFARKRHSRPPLQNDPGFVRPIQPRRTYTEAPKSKACLDQWRRADKSSWIEICNYSTHVYTCVCIRCMHVLRELAMLPKSLRVLRLTICNTHICVDVFTRKKYAEIGFFRR